VIEGDSPLRDADLRVFVAPLSAAGQTLLVRERRDRAAQQRAQADAMQRLLGEPDGAARLLAAPIHRQVGRDASIPRPLAVAQPQDRRLRDVGFRHGFWRRAPAWRAG